MAIDLTQADLKEMGRRFFAKELRINDAAEPYSKDELVNHARLLTEQMAETVAAMSPAQVSYRLPEPPSGWDASGDEEEFDTSEIVTHVAMGTAFYWYGLSRGLGHGRPRFPRAPRGTSVTGKTGVLFGRGGWRGMLPADLAGHLRTMNNEFFAYVETIPDTQESLTSEYEGFDDLNLKGWLMLLVVHLSSHQEQIEDLQAQLDYPRE